MNSYNLNKKSALKAVTLQEVKSVPNLQHSIQNTRDKVHYQKWKNKDKHKNILKTTQQSSHSDRNKNKNSYKNSLLRPLTKQKISTNTVCC